MKTLAKKAFIFFCIGLLFTGKALAQGALEFVENKGQWERVINFKGDLSNGAFFLRQTGFTVLQHNSRDLVKLSEAAHGKVHDSSNNNAANLRTAASTANAMIGKPVPEHMDSLRSHAYTVDFVGANQHPDIVPEKPQPTYNNYFIGDDPSQWKGDCKIYNAVTYKNVYPGIDVRYYSESGYLKYEFVVHPGADPSQIVMNIEGADGLSLKNNTLIIKTSVNEVKELSPYTYQYTGTERKEIDCRYVLKGNTVRFALKKFSAQSTLIIDPTLIFATFSGSTSDNWGYTATYGKDGTFYAGGIVFQNGFPASPGAFQTLYRGSQVSESGFWNMGIIKFNASGSQRLYATYIGGSSKDQPHSLFVDTDGNLVIAGRTTSGNYPLVPSNASFGSPLGGWDIVVTKLNATGTALIGSVRVGGSGDDGFNTADSHTAPAATGLINNYGDDARSEVILDAANNIYVASCTQSANFYTTANAQQKTFGGKQDAVLLKLNPGCSSVVYSSYLGGSDYDAGFVLALNPTTQDIYMAGGTLSNDFPGNKAGVYQPAFAGGRSDGFVAEFSNDGATLRRTTYVGTNGLDVIFGIQFDRFSYPYIMGTTTGIWPVKNAAYSNPGSKQFITKMEKDLSAVVYSTVFGNGSSTPNISPVAFLVDRCENVYVSGWGKDIIGGYNLSSISGMPLTRDALKSQPDESEFYFIVIKRNASQLLYGTFYGQNGRFGEHVDGGTSRFDQNGIIYQAICANCKGQDGVKPQWPVTPGAWCCSGGRAAATTGSECNLAALKISFNFAGVASGVRAFINNVLDTSGCVPLKVVFRDTVLNAQHYEWNFGDGSADVPTDSFEIAHIYNQVGSYRVRLIAIDSTSCNIRDTSFTTVIVRNNQAILDFNPVKLPPCESLTYRFDNLSVPPVALPFHDQTFIWDFGDKTPRVIAGTAPVQHTYQAVGTYTVRLILLDTNYCNAPDSVVKELRISPQVKAEFKTPSFGCAPYRAVFTNTSLGGQIFTWSFGDGVDTVTSGNPAHTYTEAGTYIVKLKAYDSSTCNLVDSTQTTIVVQTKPLAAFTTSPDAPVQNTPITFTNSSVNATRYKWEFGDGDSLITVTTADIFHQYNRTGQFNACLIAYNAAGCSDTVCHDVKTVVVPQLDIPNAFTPLGPVQANTIYVRGFAIGKMRFAVYNRLGQKVFESNTVSQGWDGRFKGVVQPMDVYAYTLDVEFTDGTRVTKKGDITLIR